MNRSMMCLLRHGAHAFKKTSSAATLLVNSHSSLKTTELLGKAKPLGLCNSERKWERGWITTICAQVVRRIPRSGLVPLASTVDLSPLLPACNSPRMIHTSTLLAMGPRFKEVRRKKMNKHKRLKRLKKRWFHYVKKHALKKKRGEMEFRGRMKAIIDDMESFDAMNYVKDVIRRAKREWEPLVAPSGRRKYQHWSESTMLEELYGIEKSDYIDKRAGLPAPEDKAKIAHIRDDYLRRYTVVREVEKGGKGADGL